MRRPRGSVMKRSDNHNGFWIGICVGIVLLAAAGVFLIHLFLNTEASVPPDGTASRAEASAGASEPAPSGTVSAPSVSILLPTLPPETEEAPAAVRSLSESELDQLEAAIGSLDELRENAAYQAGDDAQRAQMVLSQLDTLAGQGAVIADSIYYDEEGGYISYLYSSGITGIEELSADPDTDGAAGLLPAERSVTVLSAAAPQASLPAAGFADAIILNGMTDRTKVMKYCVSLKDAWNKAGLITDIDTHVTLDDLKSLASYEFVYVKMHGICAFTYTYSGIYPLGGERTRVLSSYITLEQKPSKSLNKQYEEELTSGRVILKDGYYGVSPDFIREHYHRGSLSGNIIFLGCCELLGKEGYLYEGWKDAFADASLSAFVAFHNSNYTDYNLDLVGTFTQELLSGRTAGEAYNRAIEVNGRNDRIWNGESSATIEKAGTPFLYGNTSARLKDLPGWLGAYYGFLLNEGYAGSGEDYDVNDSDYGLAAIAFALHDLDEDGIPEIIANAGYNWAGRAGYLYTYRGGEVYLLGDGPENRSQLYFSPYQAGLYEKMASMMPADGRGRVNVYWYWSMENGRLSSYRVGESYNDDPTTFAVGDEALYGGLKEVLSVETKLDWLTPDQIREMGWYAFVQAWEQRVRDSAFLRGYRVGGLTESIAQAFLSVLPPRVSSDGETFVSAAFPDMDRDGTPEMICLTVRTDDTYGFTLTDYTLSIFAIEDGTAREKYRDVCFDHGGTYRTACRIYQIASGDLVDTISYMEALGAGQDYFVFSYENGEIRRTVVSLYEDGAPYPDTPSTFYYYRDSERIPEEAYERYVGELTEPVLEIFHGEDQWDHATWAAFLGTRIPCGFSYDRTLRILSGEGAW